MAVATAEEALAALSAIQEGDAVALSQALASISERTGAGKSLRGMVRPPGAVASLLHLAAAAKASSPESAGSRSDVAASHSLDTLQTNNAVTSDDRSIAAELVSVLTEWDVNALDERDSENATPLHYAFSEGNTEAAKRLLDSWTSRLVENVAASSDEDDECVPPVTCLCSRRDVMGEMPLHGAALAGHVACLEVLSNHVQQVSNHVPLVDMLNLLSDERNFPLALAVLNNHEHAVFWLLTHGADASLKNAKGLTAEQLSTSLGRVNCAALFDERRLQQKAFETIEAMKLDLREAHSSTADARQLSLQALGKAEEAKRQEEKTKQEAEQTLRDFAMERDAHAVTRAELRAARGDLVAAQRQLAECKQQMSELVTRSVVSPDINAESSAPVPQTEAHALREREMKRRLALLRESVSDLQHALSTTVSAANDFADYSG